MVKRFYDAVPGLRKVSIDATSTVTVSTKEKTAKGEKVDETITEVNIYDQLEILKNMRSPVM